MEYDIKVYYNGYIEEFKRFMLYFRDGYPELYERYKSFIALPQKGKEKVVIKKDEITRPVVIQILTHIIREYDTLRYN